VENRGTRRRGITSTAFVGAGQTSRQIPQPVHTSATIIGISLLDLMAPGTGHRSEQTEHIEL
jgi:hypothetical protein